MLDATTAKMIIAADTLVILTCRLLACGGLADAFFHKGTLGSLDPPQRFNASAMLGCHRRPAGKWLSQGDASPVISEARSPSVAGEVMELAVRLPMSLAQFRFADSERAVDSFWVLGMSRT
jgi:hypothetical protein